MKTIVLLLAVTLIASCKQNTKKSIMPVSLNEKYASQLIDADFLQYANPNIIDSLSNDLKKSFNIYSDEIFRLAHIDAEELSEFSFDFFLPAVNKILAKRNIHLSAKKLNNEDSSFDVLINNDTIELYTARELKNGTFWDTAPKNFFKKLNEIIKTKNSDERFYLLYSWNDLHAILLTEKQYSIIADYYKYDKKETPYQP